MTRVLAVGAYIADHFMEVTYLPRPGESVEATSYAIQDGGKAANAAVAAARLGADVALFAALGDDEADAVLKRLAAERIDVTGCQRVDVPTGRSHILVDQDAAQWVATWPGASAHLDLDAVADAWHPAPGDVLLLQGEIPTATSRAFLNRIPAGVRTILNPSPVKSFADASGDEWLRGQIDVVVVNELEADQLFPAGRLGENPAGVAREAVVVTRGPDGAELHAGEVVATYPAATVDPVDPTGAGDCFTGTLAAALAAGLRIEHGVAIAVRAATASVSRRYCMASYPTPADLGIAPLTPDHIANSGTENV